MNFDRRGLNQISLNAVERFDLLVELGLECAPSGGQIAGLELTGAAGLSEDESHGQAPLP